MSDDHNPHKVIADTFGRDIDRLSKYHDQFEQLEIDPFQQWLRDEIYSKDLADGTVDTYEGHVRQWQDFMRNHTQRHPAVPRAEHVSEFIAYQLNEKGNSAGTVSDKLRTITRVYKYFQREYAYPHPIDFNPFETARKRADLSSDDPDHYHPISVKTLGEKIRNDIKHIRDRGLIVTQLKLGIRASEMANIRIPEIHIDNSELMTHYEDMGNHPMVEDRPNSVYIPPDREQNKSDRPRVLPLDDELRRVLIQYLLCRPDNGRPWVFLSKSGAKKLDQDNINNVWKKHFRPEYGPTDRYRGVSSHFGRHKLTTWLKVDCDWSRERVKYARGDKQGGANKQSDDEFVYTREAIDSYIHAYYPHIEDRYREQIYKFRI